MRLLSPIIVIFGFVIENCVAKEADPECDKVERLKNVVSKNPELSLRQINHTVSIEARSRPLGKLYSFVQRQVSFGETFELCRYLDAELLTIDSDAEHDYIANILTSLDNADFWVYASDIFGKWTWLGNGRPVESSSWASGDSEPNNPGGEKNCAAASSRPGADWRLGKRECNSRYNYMCAYYD